MDDIIKLIDLSLEDGRLNSDDYRIILNKAQAQGISEEEFNLILSKRSRQSEALKSTNEIDTRSKLPYILAILAVALTFVDWFGVYSNSKVMSSSASWDHSFSGWWGGYGATVILIYSVGCYLYFKGNRFYWLTGLLAVVDAVYIYSALDNADVAFSYDIEGYGWSAEAGYELLWGFWSFIVVSSLFALSALVLTQKGDLHGKFKLNFKAGKMILTLTFVLNIVVQILIYILTNPFNEDLIIVVLFSIIFSLIFSAITLISYMFSSSIRTAAYFLFAFGLICWIVFYSVAKEGAYYLFVFIMSLSFPLCYIAIERIVKNKNNKSTSLAGLPILFIVSLFALGCSEQPKMKFQSSNSEGINNSESINGTYTSVYDGIESSLNVMGDSWYGTHVDTNMGNIIASSSGMIDGNKIYDEYGVELGYISNGRAYVNLGGMELTLVKKINYD